MFQRHYLLIYTPRTLSYSPILTMRKLRFREDKYLMKGTWLLRGRARLKPSVLCQGCVLSICLIISDINFDHLIKVLSTRFLHCRSTVFSLCN